MSIERRERLYEILVRYGHAEGGLTVAAHQRRIVELVDADTGDVLGATEGDAQALDPADVAGVLGETVPALTGQVAGLQAEIQALNAAHGEALTAAGADKAAALDAAAAQTRAALDAAAADKEDALAALRARHAVEVDRLEARVAQLTAASTPEA